MAVPSSMSTENARNHVGVKMAEGLRREKEAAHLVLY